jgi:RHS repeat-associated protein
VVERYAYDAFGNVRFLDPNYGSRSSSSYAWDFLFHAEFRDPETKLYNYGHRYYDAGLGRWLSRDPIGERGGLNLYANCRNSPVSCRDSIGLQYIPIVTDTTSFSNAAADFWGWAGEVWYSTKEVLGSIPRGIGLAFHANAAGFANLFSGGKNERPASNKDITGPQLHYHWVFRKGPNIRVFDVNSGLGQHMLRSDYVVAAMNEMLLNVRRGDFTAVRVRRRLSLESPLSYPFDFAWDASGHNPARAFQGSIAGSVSSSPPFEKDGKIYVTFRVELKDVSSAPSGTHLPPVLGSYGPALIPEENPFGEKGALRNIMVSYDLRVTVPITSIPWQASPTWKSFNEGIRNDYRQRMNYHPDYQFLRRR